MDIDVKQAHSDLGKALNFGMPGFETRPVVYDKDRVTTHLFNRATGVMITMTISKPVLQKKSGMPAPKRDLDYTD